MTKTLLQKRKNKEMKDLTNEEQVAYLKGVIWGINKARDLHRESYK